MALRLANADVLPFDFALAANRVDGFVTELAALPGMGAKLDTEKAGRRRKADLKEVRQRWATMANAALVAAGVDQHPRDSVLAQRRHRFRFQGPQRDLDGRQ